MIFKALTVLINTMKIKHIAGAVLIAIGSTLTFKGAIDGNQSMINAGIGGVFFGGCCANVLYFRLHKV